MFRDILMRIIGIFCVYINHCTQIFKSNNRPKGISELDKTGRCTNEAYPVKIIYNDGRILFADYKHSLSHSFWRSQEISLFLIHKHLFNKPVLDFGCGDGSFTSILFNDIDYGVDCDEEALAVARDYRIYKKLGKSINDLKISNGYIQSVFSNSVLEHVINLEESLKDIYNILSNNGIFVFTVPVMQFRRDLGKYFGFKESERINNEFYHRNLIDIEDWIKLLNNIGFSVENMIQYQPDWFTFIHRVLNTSGIGGIINRLRKPLFCILKKRIIMGVRESIENTQQGSNIFVVARKF